jgi:hypothetical protein
MREKRKVIKSRSGITEYRIRTPQHRISSIPLSTDLADPMRKFGMLDRLWLAHKELALVAEGGVAEKSPSILLSFPQHMCKEIKIFRPAHFSGDLFNRTQSGPSATAPYGQLPGPVRKVESGGPSEGPDA